MIITSRRQRRVLAEIRRALGSSDPRMVARFALFTRLTEGEQMPAAERIRPWPLCWDASVFGRGRRGRPGAGGRAGWPAGRPVGISRRLAAIVFIPAAAAVLISVPFILGHGRAAAACMPAAAAQARAQQLPFSAPGWTVPACHRAGLSRHSAGRRLRVT